MNILPKEERRHTCDKHWDCVDCATAFDEAKKRIRNRAQERGIELALQMIQDAPIKYSYLFKRDLDEPVDALKYLLIGYIRKGMGQYEIR